MPKDRRGHAKLSKGVLEMKFMQRTKNRMRAEKEAEESRTMYEKDISKGMQNAVMTQRPVELRPERPMPIRQKDYGRQIAAIYENEVELIRERGVQGADTPGPIDDPLTILRSVADHVSAAAWVESPCVRNTCADGGILALYEVTRWIPTYQQIVIERDELLQRRAEWEEERKELKELREMRERWAEERNELIARMDQIRASYAVTPPPVDEPLSARTSGTERLPIPSVDDMGTQSSGGCELLELTGLFPLSGAR
uniref:Signal-induced proliferation-associated 1-like protein 2 n=1 Tax=Lygus hesperus TaxID=30085 RepID=A0A0A9WG45_LYGHE